MVWTWRINIFEYWPPILFLGKRFHHSFCISLFAKRFFVRLLQVASPLVHISASRVITRLDVFSIFELPFGLIYYGHPQLFLTTFFVIPFLLLYNR